MSLDRRSRRNQRLVAYLADLFLLFLLVAVYAHGVVVIIVDTHVWRRGGRARALARARMRREGAGASGGFRLAARAGGRTSRDVSGAWRSIAMKRIYERR